MRLCVAVLIVSLSCGIAKSDAGSLTVGFAVASQEATDAVEEATDQHNATDDFVVGDEHRDNTTSPPTAIHLPVLPSLPALPFLPALPALPALPISLFPPRSTITATKTLYAEVTHRVTRHPVCMTVRGVKPPCLPVQLYNRDFEPDCCQHDDAPAEESLWDDEQQEGLYIEPTSVPRIPPATSQLTAPEQAVQTPELESSREGRYLEFRRQAPVPLATTTSDNTARLLNLPPETHYATQTLWVTRVLKVTDYRVTATLEAKNCVPVDLKVPFCQTPPPQKPPHSVTTTPPHQVTKPPQHAALQASDYDQGEYKPLDRVHSEDDKHDVVNQQVDDTA